MIRGAYNTTKLNRRLRDEEAYNKQFSGYGIGRSDFNMGLGMW